VRGKEMAEKLKESQVHAIFKALSPKREVNSPKLGQRAIPRSINPEALSYLTFYLNSHLIATVKACEQSLAETNSNPNNYYQQHRIDLRVAKRAIEILKEEISE
jgi:hypothetical protein